ncbi:MAG: hypothetical protein OMM_05349 [Candidatus Magnetoglobus multicellularis str. Araruama]|uniref:Uncharacterized protein n=1 Tax=Candidatus Magnetoglobus multicellularis str. Araruama TaxID=890399 RepID=A0A1V1NWS7_9BACT|nr:MAG: hypothetical protein OMM_05349 [Candidatus Magnetoglobus multicellularis str. Araruama]
MSDISLTPLSKPISPSVNQQQPNKPYQPSKNNTDNGTIKFTTQEIDKSNVQILPPGRKKIEAPELKKSESFQQSQKAAFKESEIEQKKAELPFIKDEDTRKKLQSEIYHLNLKLEELKKSEKGPNIQGAQFRLNEDDEGFYVELINVDQDVVIKELSEENFEDILRQTSDTNNLGVLLDLFA